MRRNRRWAVLGVLFALSAFGVSVPPPVALADDPPPIVQFAPKKCTGGNVTIQPPVVCTADCPPVEGCTLGICGRDDCGGMTCGYHCE